MTNDWFPWRHALVAIALIGLATTTAEANAGPPAPIELTSNDGSVSLKGELIEFTDGVYVIEVPGFGRLQIDSEMATCAGAGCPIIKPEFSIYGSRTIGNALLPNLLRGYARSVGAQYQIHTPANGGDRTIRLTHADGTLRVEVTLQTKGTGSAFPALARGQAQIGMTDRRMTDADLATLGAVGVGDLRDTPHEALLGLDGIVLITHPDNPVPNLSALDVARIWSGEVTNWLELGGGNVPITVYSFDEGSDDRAVLLDRLVVPTGREEKADAVRWSTDQEMVDAVMANRGGIGFVGRWLARTSDVNQLAIREECGLLSPPSDFQMKIEGYPLSRRLYLYALPERVHPEAEAFLAWTQTDEAQPYIRQSNFIDRRLERMRLEDMGMMLVHTAAVEPDFNGPQFSDMMRTLRNADRLSVSFRFLTGSSTLDADSVRNLEELAARMEAGQFDGQEVMLVGFADSVASRRRNTFLAQLRAEEVRRILVNAISRDTLERLKLIPMSYGELLPLSCNTEEVGRARNRRVEVWLRTPGITVAGR